MGIARSAGALVALGASLIVSANSAIAEEGGARATGIDAMGSQGIDAMGSQGIDAMGSQGIDAMGSQGIDAMGSLGIDAMGSQGIDAMGSLGIDAMGSQGIDAMGSLGIDAMGSQGIDAMGSLGIDAMGSQGIDAMGGQGIDAMGGQGIDAMGGQGIDAMGGQGIDAMGGQGIDAMGGQGIDAMGGQGIDAMGGQGIDAMGGQGIDAMGVLSGPVDRIDHVNGVFESMGQIVMTSREALAGLKIGDFVSVDGSVVSPGWLYADGVSVSSTPYVPGASEVFVTGMLSSVDRLAGTARMGGLTIDYTPSLGNSAAPSDVMWSFSGTRPGMGGVMISDRTGGLR